SPHGEPVVYEEIPHGGYFSLDDLAEIGAYARARAVTVVPELDVPGHATAILAAYPEFGATGEEYEVLDRWGISPAILSPLPETVAFLTTVMDEWISALGSVPYFHLGGDEVVLDHWDSSPAISRYRESLGLSSAAELHGWFLRRLADLLAERGTRAVVWDEAFVAGSLRQDTIVMPWRGMGVGRRAVAAGHDVVACPVFPLYLNYAASGDAAEPLAIGDTITLDDVLAFEPAPASWTEEERSRVLGLQGQLWSEWIADAATLDYHTWPRGCALAEIGWYGSPGDDFAGRLAVQLERLDAIGVDYRPLDGPRPWQRRRPHQSNAYTMAEAMVILERMAETPDSTRPSM
ncbi:MAG: family 20 glycosylhydrolase, partial [Nonomuraea sp.]|nr:family 20 glycosylhydrolase [Nonomuraea sp.]